MYSEAVMWREDERYARRGLNVVHGRLHARFRAGSILGLRLRFMGGYVRTPPPPCTYGINLGLTPDNVSSIPAEHKQVMCPRNARRLLRCEIMYNEADKLLTDNKN